MTDRQGALTTLASGEEVTLYEMETGSSLLAEHRDVPRTERRLITATLDEVADSALPGVESLFPSACKARSCIC